MTGVDTTFPFAYDITARHHLITPEGGDPRRNADPTMTLSPYPARTEKGGDN